MSVRYVNCFEVAEGCDHVFLERWREINAYMTKKPGYISDRLHRSLDPRARFRFINYLEWESPELHAAAHDEGFLALVSSPTWRESVHATGAFYEIVHEGRKDEAARPVRNASSAA